MKHLILSLSFLLFSFYINSQITIKKDSIVEKPLLKPKIFDSLSNFKLQNRFVDYKKYIGYKLFFLPNSNNFMYKDTRSDTLINYLFSENFTEVAITKKLSAFEDISPSDVFGDSRQLKGEALIEYNQKVHFNKFRDVGKSVKTNLYRPQFYYTKEVNSNGQHFGKMGTPYEVVAGKYFTILDIKGKKYIEDTYKKLEDVNESAMNLGLCITLKNDETNDTLQWIIKYASEIEDFPFFLVPYFEKQQKLYKGQNMVAQRSYSDLIDIKTGELVNIKSGEKWECYDVSFTDSKRDKFLTPFYFLKNGNHEIALQFGSFDNESFILEKEFIRREEEKKKAEEQRIKEQQEKERLAKEEEKKHRNKCIAKYGSKMGTCIADGTVLLGMNKEMCEAAWGSPIGKNTTSFRGSTREQWVYGWSTYLYFDNGVLTIIQN